MAPRGLPRKKKVFIDDREHVYDVCACLCLFFVCATTPRPKQQAKMAEYCRSIFGDALLTEPLEKYLVST